MPTLAVRHKLSLPGMTYPQSVAYRKIAALECQLLKEWRVMGEEERQEHVDTINDLMRKHFFEDWLGLMDGEGNPVCDYPRRRGQKGGAPTVPITSLSCP